MSDLLVHKSIRHHYEILEQYEAGIQLHGWEVKSLRNKHGSIKESYIVIDNNEVWLINAFIPAYQANHALRKNDDPYRKRKLLFSRKEIQELIGEQKHKGLTLVPTKIYNKNNLIKIGVALARGKKLHDKRASLKDRTAKREAERAMKY